jgi:hypothetical protein
MSRVEKCRAKQSKAEQRAERTEYEKRWRVEKRRIEQSYEPNRAEQSTEKRRV